MTNWYQRMVSAILRVVEKWYLLAHGWEKVREDHYFPPGDYPFHIKTDEYHRRHAVNAQHAVYGEQTRRAHLSKIPYTPEKGEWS